MSIEHENPAIPDVVGNPGSQGPAREDIARGAYLLWEQKGRPPGTEVENWLEAEARLRQLPAFDVILTQAGDRKVHLVRELRAATGLELPRVKDIVDTPPQALQRALRREEAEALVETIRAAGGSAELTPTH
jgi:ribosomal protein L7/L12